MRITKNIYVAFVGLLVAVGALMALNVTGTTTRAISSYRDCGDDAIVYCGALSQSELLQKYDKNDGDVQGLYAHYGISRSDIAGQTSTVKMGTVNRAGVVVVDGKTVATGARSVSRTYVNGSNAITVNGTKYYEEDTSSFYHETADAYVMFRNGQFYRAIMTSCGNAVVATPVKPPVQPVYSCDSLKADKIDRTNFKFTSAATAKNGASIVSYTYNFGDNSSKTVTSTSVNHTYAKPGTYTVTVTVNIKVNDTTKAVTSTACKTTVKVEAVPVTPLYACNSLTAQIVSTKANTFAYTLSYTAENGATLSKVVYNFGDNTTATIDAAKATSAQHTYAKEGSYRTTATLYFNVKNGDTTTVKTINCEVATNIAPEMCTLPGKENFPKNSPECAQEMCTIPGKENLPKNSSECVETPPTLPQTGMEDLLSGGVGLSSLTAAGYYFVNSRKSLIDALLRR